MAEKITGKKAYYGTVGGRRAKIYATSPEEAQSRFSNIGKREGTSASFTGGGAPKGTKALDGLSKTDVLNDDIVSKAIVKAGGQLSNSLSLPTPPTVGLNAPQVDTTKPSPQNVNATPFTNVAPASTQPVLSPMQPTTTEAANKFKTAHQTLTSSGAPAPQSSGQANAAISSMVPKKAIEYTPQPQIQDSLNQTLEVYSKAVADFLQPVKQRDTLMSQYDKMSKSLGIQKLNSELIDVNRIMDGTEDDIRAEVTAAAGFATDSQVEAMTISRNKTLLKKAQYISDQLTSAKDQLNTMMSLSAQDRDYADKRMQTGMSLLGNMVQIQMSMKKAAQDNYNNIAAKVGYDGLLNMTGGDPYNVGLVEQSLGLGRGGLQQLAQQSMAEKAKVEEERQLDLQYKRGQLSLQQSNLATDRLQRQKILQDIENSKPINVNTISSSAPSSVKNMDVLTQIFGSNKVSPGNKTAIGAGLALAKAANDLAEANPDGKFRGISPFSSLVPSFLKKEQTIKNESLINALNLQTQFWASGAALTKEQTKSVEKMIPKKTDTDKIVRAKSNQLVNYMLSQTSSKLVTDGISYTPEKVDLFNVTPTEVENMDNILNQ